MVTGIVPPKKCHTLCTQNKMAKSPVDRSTELMQQTTGARVLITDLAADKYLERSQKLGVERYNRWCGGKGGFDDFAERMH